jgi:hypothetical protein
MESRFPTAKPAANGWITDMPEIVRRKTTLVIEISYLSTAASVVEAVNKMLPGKKVAIVPDVREDDPLLYTIVSTSHELA